MGRRILASLLAMALIFALPVFSFSAGESVPLKDSGSPMVSMMSMRAIAANEGISLAAAEGNSGQFGYDIRPFEGDLNFVDYAYGSSSSRNYYSFYLNLPVGQYIIDFELSENMTNAGAVYYTGGSGSVIVSRTVNNNKASLLLNVPSSGRFEVYGYNSSGFSSSVSSINFKVNSLKPVEGISSGYTYNSGLISRSTRSIFNSFDADFGSQPAGKYLVNIYHWGDSYNLIFHIHDSSDSYYLPSTTNGGVTTFVYNHSGGQFTFGGSFTASNDETSVIDGNLSGAGMGDYFQLLGELGADGPLSWTFNITDIVAIPYDQAADHNFGFFAPIIGFLRDGFSSIKLNVVNQFSQLKTHLTTQYNGMKTFIEQQVTRIVGDDSTKNDVQDAADELNKEVQDLQSLSGDLNTQSSNLQQQFATDFAIPDELSSNSSNIQLIFSFIFSTFGIYTIFIWLPVVLAVIKKLLRL